MNRFYFLIGILIFQVVLICRVYSQSADEFQLIFPALRCAEKDTIPVLEVDNQKFEKPPFLDGTFKIFWGDGQESQWNAGGGRTLSHQYASFGKYTLTLFWTKTDGTVIQRNYPFELKRWYGTTLNVASSGSCVNSETTFKIIDYESKTEEAKYSLYLGGVGEGSLLKTVTQTELIAKKGLVTHRFMSELCDEQIVLKTTDVCTQTGGISGDMASKWITVIAPLVVDFDFEKEPVCTGIPFHAEIKNSSKVRCDRYASYEWDFEYNDVYSGGSIKVDPYQKAGSYKVTLTAQIQDYSCATTTKVKQLEVINRAVAAFTPSAETLCLVDANPATVTFTDKSSGDNTTMVWYINDKEVRDLPGNWVYDFKAPGSYHVKQHVSNSCSDSLLEVLIVVKQDPHIDKFELPDSICLQSLTMSNSHVSYRWNWDGNLKSASWKIEEPDGNVETYEGIYPQLVFKKPGKHKVTVSINGSGCGGTTLTRSEEIWVIDPTLVVDVVPGKAPVGGVIKLCDGDVLGFTNNSVGEKIKNNWVFIPAGGGSALRMEFVDKTSLSSPSPKVKWIGYGDGILTNRMSLPFGCKTESVSFQIHVGKDPEVFMTNFPKEICPRDVLDAEICIFYNWYNNSPKTRWEFFPNTVKYVGGTSADSPEPKVQFLSSEEYRYKVRISGMDVCPKGDTVVEGKLRVRESGLDVVVEERNKLSEVCEGGKLIFSNSAIPKDTARTDLNYEWDVVVPETGKPQGGTKVDCSFLNDKKNDKVAVITFNKWGTYDVVATVRGLCDTVVKTLRITVKKNPEVNLRDTVNCPGIISLADNSSYHWWNNIPEVTWEIRRQDGADQLGDYVSDPGALKQLYPKIDFKRPGKYMVKATLKHAGCPDADPFDEVEYWIYDPVVYGDVTLKNPEPGTPLVADVCENTVVDFENTQVEDANGLRWEWTVESGVVGGYEYIENGVVIEPEQGRTKRMPSIRFLKYGEYKVNVTTFSTCNAPIVKEFKVIVRGIPEIILQSRMDKICAPGTLDLKEKYLQYVDKKNNILTYQWTVVADRDVTLPVFDPVAEFPVFNFTENARYTITLEAFSRCAVGGKQVLTSDIDVIASLRKSAFLVDSVGCTDFEVTLDNRSQGDSLSYTWRVVPQTESGAGWHYISGDDHSEKPQLKITEAGFYDVSLQVSNICGSDVSDFRVKAYSVPEIEIGDIAEVCEPFTFIGKERITIRENNDPIRSVQWKITEHSATVSEEYKYINKTTEHSIYPDIVFKTCDYEISAEYYNRCPEPGRKTFLVRVDKFIPITGIEDKAVCVQTEPFQLTALPDGGSWKLRDESLPGASKILYRDGDGRDWFNPTFDFYFEGDIELIYSKANLACMARDTMNVHVWSRPRVDAGSPLEMCINHEPFLLKNGTPENGYWTLEDGVTQLNGDLYSASVVGDFKLKYYFRDENTCINVDSTVMSVRPLPNTKFNVEKLNCILTEVVIKPEQLDGNRFEWDFGDGSLKEVSNGEISHIFDDFGFRKISNVTTSKYGCVDRSDSVSIEIVNVPPPAFFVTDTLKGCARFGVEEGNNKAVFEVNISVDTNTYADNHNHLSFYWNYGDGNSSDELLPVCPKYFPSGAWDTTYVVNFKVSNMCGVREYDTVITVLSAPKVMFALKHEWECTPVVLELQNTTTGNNATFDWTFENGRTGELVERTNVRNPIHEFTTDSTSTTYYITLKATNSCDEDVRRDSLVVKPRTIVSHFTPAKRDICVGEEICFKNNSTDTLTSIENTYWNFGDGARDTTWNACHVYQSARKYIISLLIDNGCGFHSSIDSITVHPLPNLKLLSEDYLCEADTFTFVVRSDQELKYIGWDFGDGQTGNLDSLRHLFDGYGKRLVTVKGVSAQIASCVATVSKEVEIHNKPIVTITPLDTIECSPLLYKPEITGDGFFTWDFGDGSVLTTASEHLYENITDTVQKFNVTAYVETDKGCKSVYNGHVTLYYLPRAAVDKVVAKGRPEKVIFQNLSKGGMDSYWELPFKGVVHSQDDQELEFSENGLYNVRLIEESYYGCRDTADIEHRVEMKGLFFPNTFIPQSMNGKVSHFNGIAMGLKEFWLEIYDLYGNKIWETKALEDGKPSEGWDGRNGKGEMMPQGSYIWRARAIFVNDNVWTGKNNDSGVTETVQGTVLLLRE